MSLLVSAVQCCAGVCAAEKKPNDSKRDGIGLPKEFYGICIVAIVELYGFFHMGRRVFLLAPPGWSKLSQRVWTGLSFLQVCDALYQLPRSAATYAQPDLSKQP